MINMIYLDIDKNVEMDTGDGVIEIHDIPIIVIECSYCNIRDNRCSIDWDMSYSPIVKLPDNWMVGGNINTGPLYCCPACNEDEVYKD
tara:strand:+ start:160 stop:423 length:264 start_codon:yes stop_codon:yes gene_type:complete